MAAVNLTQEEKNNIAIIPEMARKISEIRHTQDVMMKTMISISLTSGLSFIVGICIMAAAIGIDENVTNADVCFSFLKNIKLNILVIMFSKLILLVFLGYFILCRFCDNVSGLFQFIIIMHVTYL